MSNFELNNNVNLVSDINEVHSYDVLHEHETVAQGGEGSPSIILNANEFNLDLVKDAVASFTDKGYNFVPDGSLLSAAFATVSRIFYSISFVLKFDENWGIAPSVASLYSAMTPNYQPKGELNTIKPHPMGKPGQSVYFTSRGVVSKFDSNGQLDIDSILVSRHWNYDVVKANFLAACEILGGVKHTQAAEAVLASNNFYSYYQTNKEFINNAITQANTGDLPIIAKSTFSDAQYGINSGDMVIAQQQRAQVHNRIRQQTAAQLAYIAGQSGAEPGQYCEFIVVGFGYSSRIEAKTEQYAQPALSLLMHHDPTTQLMTNCVILCKPIIPVSYSGGVAKTVPTGYEKANAVRNKGLAAKLAAKRAAQPAAEPIQPVETVVPSLPSVTPDWLTTNTTLPKRGATVQATTTLLDEEVSLSNMWANADEVTLED